MLYYGRFGKENRCEKLKKNNAYGCIFVYVSFVCMWREGRSKEAAAPTEAPAPTETPAPTKAPEPTVTPEPTATPAPTATPTPIPEYKEYDYAEGNLTITLPYEAEEPIEQEGQLEFTDPNGKWTMTIEPITAGQISNCILSIESAQKYREEGAKQVKTEETKICGMNAIVFSSNLDESKKTDQIRPQYIWAQESMLRFSNMRIII